MKKFAILALAALIAMPASAAGVTIGGYIDIGYIAAEPGNFVSNVGAVAMNQRQQASGSTNGNWNANDGFVVSEVNLDLSSQLTNDISAFVSIDIMPATANAAAIDYAYVDFANPGPFDLNVRAGRIPSVIGIEQRVSESNQTKFVNLSLLSPWTVGAVDGVAVYGSFSPVNYALALTNSDNFGTGGAAMFGVNALAPGNDNTVATNASQDNNNDFAVSGRIGVVPIEGLEIGVSASLDKFQTAPVAPAIKDNRRTLMGVDASYVWGALTIKGEYITVKEEQGAVANPSDVRANGFYAEGVYDLNSKISLGVRYSTVEIEQPLVAGQATNTAIDYNTLAIAGQYRIADNVVLKAEYDINQEKVLNRVVAPSIKDANNVLAFSLVGSF